ncbi:MAG: TIGR01841 family phasin [Roseateles sp.]|uniref:TIGR01841 family phasin n=1 Tax=Roseateles sp. TaxID=1971397 RepID=UPI0039EC08F8
MATRKKAGTTAKTSASAPAAWPGLPTLDDLKGLAEQFKLPGVDLSALADWQRKDLETIAEAQRQAYEGIKSLVERRNEILAETLAEWQAAMKEVRGADAPAKAAGEAVKGGVQRAIENFRELSEMEAKARSDTWKVLQDRLQENMASLQQLLAPKK